MRHASADARDVDFSSYLEAPDNFHESKRVKEVSDEIPVDHVDTECEVDSIE